MKSIDPTVQSAWTNEAKTRRDAVRDGSVQTIAGGDALTQIKCTVAEKLDIGKTEKSNLLILH
jgi:hypothetical protein